MLTREQIEEIQTESREKGVSIKNLLKEKGIPESQYFWWKRKYSKAEAPEGFLPISGGGLPAAMVAHLSGAATSSREKSKSDAAGENWMSIELRTAGGTDMRIQGGLTPAMMYTILKSLQPMFSLGDGTKFWLYTKPTDMRKNFNMLSGIVNSHMGQNLYSGDVFVFVNSANNMMKLLRYEPGGMVIYNKRLDHGSMHLVERVQDGDPSITPFEWHRLVDTIQGIIDDPRRRLQRLKALRDIHIEALAQGEKTI